MCWKIWRERFEFLALRDDFKYVLKHSADFQNADGTAVNRDAMSKNFDEVDAAINTMDASVCLLPDAVSAIFTTCVRRSTCFRSPPEIDGSRVATGSALALWIPWRWRLSMHNRIARSSRLLDRNGAADGQTLEARQAKETDQLPADEQRGYTSAYASPWIATGTPRLRRKERNVALADPSIAAVRNSEPPSLYTLGFDIASGIFGPKRWRRLLTRGGINGQAT
jgi:hypothetical protein